MGLADTCAWIVYGPKGIADALREDYYKDNCGLPIVKAPSGGSGRWDLTGTKADVRRPVTAVINSGLSRGFPNRVTRAEDDERFADR